MKNLFKHCIAVIIFVSYLGQISNSFVYDHFKYKQECTNKTTDSADQQDEDKDGKTEKEDWDNDKILNLQPVNNSQVLIRQVSIIFDFLSPKYSSKKGILFSPPPEIFGCILA
jgi:hypothetical protein